MPIVGVLNPALLALGLACVAVPILVHLLRRRHRPVEWGAMRFLEQAYRKRRRRLTLEQLLLLLTRIALVVAIAVGVGALLTGSGRGAPVSLVIVLDDSIHSGERSGSTTLFEAAKRRADALLASLDPSRGDRAALLTLGAPARAVASPETSDIGFVRRALERLEPTHAARDAQGVARLVDALGDRAQGSTRKLVLVASAHAWSLGSWDAVPGAVDSVLVDALGVDAPRAPNAAIVDAASLAPLLTREESMPHAVVVTLGRARADAALSTRVRLFDHASGDELGVASVSMGAGERSRSVAIPFDPPGGEGGALVLRARIGADANEADNERLIGIARRSTIRVGIIDTYARDDRSSVRPSRWVRAALDASDELVETIEIDAGAAATRLDPRLDALFVLAPGALSEESWGRVHALRDAGVSVIVTPDREGVPPGLARRLAPMLPWIPPDEPVSAPRYETPLRIIAEDASHPLIRGIRAEIPTLAASVRIERLAALPGVPDDAVVLRTSDGSALVVAGAAPESPQDPGRVVLLGVALDESWTDLPARPVFVALVHEILRRAVGDSASPRAVPAGASDTARTLSATLDEGAWRLVNPDARETVRDPATSVQPERALGPDDRVRRAGDDPRRALRAGAERAAPIGPAPFAFALALALLESVLAKRCSFGQTRSARGAGRGARS